MRFFLLSRAALPASSKISAQRSGGSHRGKRSREKSVLVRDRITFRDAGRTLEDRSKVDGAAIIQFAASSCPVALFEVSVDPADGELRGKGGVSWSGRVRAEVETDKGGDRTYKNKAKRTWRPAPDRSRDGSSAVSRLTRRELARLSDHGRLRWEWNATRRRVEESRVWVEGQERWSVDLLGCPSSSCGCSELMKETCSSL